MPSNWSKGLKKETNVSVRKISETMKHRKLDNFSIWRERMKKEGKIKSVYPKLKKDGDLAELIGVVLGDGHICVYPRTEELRLTSNANNFGFINRYAVIMKKVFGKIPYIINSNQSNSTKIGLYEKYISERMGIPSGARKNLVINVPKWIFLEKKYILRYLRGLYEAEGSLNFHKKTYTHKLIFANVNKSMLDNVFNLMEKVGFHPHRSTDKIQLSRKKEVQEAVRMIKFRKY